MATWLEVVGQEQFGLGTGLGSSSPVACALVEGVLSSGTQLA